MVWVSPLGTWFLLNGCSSEQRGNAWSGENSRAWSGFLLSQYQGSLAFSSAPGLTGLTQELLYLQTHELISSLERLAIMEQDLLVLSLSISSV